MKGRNFVVSMHVLIADFIAVVAYIGMTRSLILDIRHERARTSHGPRYGTVGFPTVCASITSTNSNVESIVVRN